MTGRRIVSISLPHLAMEIWQRRQERLGNAPDDEVPFALTAEGPHGPVVHAMNRCARLAGVETGARVVDMRAFCPDLQVAPADVAGDRAALDRLCLWVRRWCPWSVVDGDGDGDGLVLDITGSSHLWGGEATLLVEIETRLSVMGLTSRLAVAPTWGAAWALARFGPVRAVCEDLGMLARLPVAALRLDGDTVLLLHRLGLKTIGALQAVPRLSLMRRFARCALAANPLMRLDQMMGELAEPVSSVDADPPIRVHANLAEPVFDPGPFLPELCAQMCGLLAKAGKGCRRLRLSVYRNDGEVRFLEVATALPSRDAGHLLGLFGDRLDRIDPGFGIDLIQLDVLASEALPERQSALAGRPDTALAFGQLVDRLSARFGAGKVTRQCWQARHIPERAAREASAFADGGQPPRVERPVQLFDRPEEVRVMYAVAEGPPAQFFWRKRAHQVARYQGPERIAPEWWHDNPGTRLRDYFKVELYGGGRFWIYRDGVFGDGRGERPRWFLHGFYP